MNLDTLTQSIVNCQKCPRLVSWRKQVAVEKRKAFREWEYWGKPVPGFGDPHARVLVVGLAPGAHGSNRTGRMFTGDASGEFLYAALHRAGFANQPHSTNVGDGLELKDLFISAICRCAPPGNKPLPEEVNNCLPFLVNEIALLTRVEGVVALGRLAFDQLLRVWNSQGYTVPKLEFGHGAWYEPVDGLPWLLASYHPSRQNTQTGKLTIEMFDEIWDKVTSQLFPNGHLG